MLIQRRNKNRRLRTCRADKITCTYSRRSYTRTLPIRSALIPPCANSKTGHCAYSRCVLIRCFEPQRRRAVECRACVTHKAFCHNCHLCQLLAFCLGAPFFLHTKDYAFILYITLSFACLLCVEALWVQYKRLRRVVA